MEKSQIIGIMIKHTDGDMEYWQPPLSQKDMDVMYKVLEKYDGQGDDMRGHPIEVIEKWDN